LLAKTVNFYFAPRQPFKQNHANDDKIIGLAAARLPKIGGGAHNLTTAAAAARKAHCYVERYKIIATPTNSDKFTEFDVKK